MDYKGIAQQIVNIHEDLRIAWPHLNQIAIALYDSEKEELHSFANTKKYDTQLIQTVKIFSFFPDLQKIAKSKTPSIIDASPLLGL
ncbi:MAG: hypothetical protein GW906_11915 [Epsilonproteobacteria bacterium]|nr:hypothetical protein [Campylobacterota bacterium]OIO15776.1 MAG: hypothetical protein AUJ81_06315 [Helicobacteraceae bacterium CG1_02_36_14]PIP09963.1 MAG: hypothetical protein COX50_08295 [Sulfurimonas sp. CG23_combo_of_CG06-09_8_20_14_all_36_33]PIS27018.1 MAG: hypothetical protein COT46_00415 [Sulfurimonas sp. CG08_land_8_20_14_0_20_36_33]PIU35442.1 MAG: hypothetical protein COT05_03450 [Sulfurimonas sp. CG07_land_8_20_14_0_80_36_56]PIV02759.1 MAG: hypothetical protein COS56_10805 [Sulfur